ncbi:uncharacterized protein PG986_002272 [Apiospora aurea]|uniref:Uncharacterized protein n=1 Tax=Apiospora aurea TaxID=335848 RepID=A0ABR1R129_9PEZI
MLIWRAPHRLDARGPPSSCKCPLEGARTGRLILCDRARVSRNYQRLRLAAPQGTDTTASRIATAAPSFRTTAVPASDMYSIHRSQGWGEASPEPYPESHDEYGGTHGIDQDIAPGVDWASNEALGAADSNLYIDPAMLDNTGDSSSSDGYAYADFESAQIYPETNSTL